MYEPIPSREPDFYIAMFQARFWFREMIMIAKHTISTTKQDVFSMCCDEDGWLCFRDPYREHSPAKLSKEVQDKFERWVIEEEILEKKQG